MDEVEVEASEVKLLQEARLLPLGLAGLLGNLPCLDLCRRPEL